MAVPARRGGGNVTFQYYDEGGRRRHRPWYVRNRLLVVAIAMGVVAVGALAVAIARGSTSKHDAAAETQGARNGAGTSGGSGKTNGKKSASSTTVPGGANGTSNSSPNTLVTVPG